MKVLVIKGVNLDEVKALMENGQAEFLEMSAPGDEDVGDLLRKIISGDEEDLEHMVESGSPTLH